MTLWGLPLERVGHERRWERGYGEHATGEVLIDQDYSSWDSFFLSLRGLCINLIKKPLTLFPIHMGIRDQGFLNQAPTVTCNVMLVV